MTPVRDFPFIIESVCAKGNYNITRWYSYFAPFKERVFCFVFYILPLAAL